jgi:hypothetical protein
VRGKWRANKPRCKRPQPPSSFKFDLPFPMALQAYTIHSHHEFSDKVIVLDPDNPITDAADDSEKHWALSSGSRLPPKFVPAQLPVDEYGRQILLDDPSGSADSVRSSEKANTKDNGVPVSEWYKSLKRAQSSRATPSLPLAPKVDPPKQRQPSENKSQSTSERDVTISHKPNWFSPSYKLPTPSGSGSSTPNAPSETIAARLARDPPNPPGSTSKRAPVWIALGPSNKGYEMLANKGWREGEGLGARVGLGMTRELLRIRESGASRSAPSLTTERDTRASRGEEVIDLTLSEDEEITIEDDSASGDEEDFDSFLPSRSASPPPNETSDQPHALPSGGTSLLTPLPTILKSDRRGIGISTTYTTLPSGIHVPSRRVTHGEKALRRHVVDMERSRRERLKWGGGARGYKRKAKAESQIRQNLLAYMNT